MWRTHLGDYLDAVTNTSPLVIAMVAHRRALDDGGILHKLAVALLLPIMTAAITAFATAYVTQAVMTEQVRQLREDVKYNRDFMMASIRQLQEDDRANLQRIHEEVANQRNGK